MISMVLYILYMIMLITSSVYTFQNLHPYGLFLAGLWIRIRIRIGSGFRSFVDPDPDPYWASGSGSNKGASKKLSGVT
jgi:hypothetical protein